TCRLHRQGPVQDAIDTAIEAGAFLGRATRVVVRWWRADYRRHDGGLIGVTGAGSRFHPCSSAAISSPPIETALRNRSFAHPSREKRAHAYFPRALHSDRVSSDGPLPVGAWANGRSKRRARSAAKATRGNA